LNANPRRRPRFTITPCVTDHERAVIRQASLRHFGVKPRLFGSRLDDARRGGDVDLLIATQMPPEQAVSRRLDLLAELWRHLGERKIDVVLDDGRSTSAIVENARRQALPV
jgi:hypothetical protein